MSQVQLLFALIFNSIITLSQGRAMNYYNQLNYIASQSAYANYVFKSPFTQEDIMRKSLEMALNSCQDSFQWQRWNCPPSDFYRRHKTQPQWLDAEDAYVNAITTAAVLYNINKDCSGGYFTECGCTENQLLSSTCSDNPQKAEELYRKHIMQPTSSEQLRLIRQHNLNAVSNLIRKSMQEKCSLMHYQDSSKKNCVYTLKPFHEIAKEIYNMYDNAVQLTKSTNAKIVWQNIPLDELVYNAETANYCEIEAVPHWNGMRGRQCLMGASGEGSCEELCTDCGHKVSLRHVITEQQCNCKIMWNYQISCESCINVEQQYYCY